MRAALATFKETFQGDVLEPETDGYEAVSSTLLATGHPAVVLRPAGTADVQAAVRFAAASGPAVAVRGGGHSFPGFGTNDGGIVIDLSRLDGTEVLDPDSGLVRVGGGATWGAVANALAPYRLAISSGDTRGVGVGGLTLSGGIGWKVRKYGLALDALVAADVVTADGALVRAAEDENAELFWALRGGGGNLGVVVAFEFLAHRTTDVFHGRIAFPPAQAEAVLQGWAEYMRTATEDLTSLVVFANPFAGGTNAPVEVFVVVDTDDQAQADAALEPIRRLGGGDGEGGEAGAGGPIADEVTLKPYSEVLVDGLTPPPGIRLVTRSAYVNQESVPAVLSTLAEIGAETGSPVLAVRSLGGAAARIADDATAYAHRSAELLVITTAAGPAPVLEATAPARAAIWSRLAPHTVGAYANFLSDVSESDVSAVYPEKTYDRIAAVKRKYDPENLFRGNHNVKPE